MTGPLTGEIPTLDIGVDDALVAVLGLDSGRPDDHVERFSGGDTRRGDKVVVLFREDGCCSPWAYEATVWQHERDAGLDDGYDEDGQPLPDLEEPLVYVLLDVGGGEWVGVSSLRPKGWGRID